MQLGMIGLGRMGGNMVRRLIQDGHDLVVFDHDSKSIQTLVGEGAVGADSLADLVDKLEAPRSVWIMVPAGDATDATVTELADLMAPGDLVIDGGNSYFKDDVRRSKSLESRKIGYVDVGTSGGVWGLERGYCMMIGGQEEDVVRLDPIFKSLAPGPAPGTVPATKAESGYMHAGPAGSGHFVKMIHNGIEYGMMQAFAEGFEILKEADSEKVSETHRYNLDLHEIAEVWRHGSVVSSWLLDLLEIALREDQDLSSFTGHVSDSGEGRWTVQTAIEEDVPAHVLTTSLYTRVRSRQEGAYADKILSALREQFGGHKEPGKSG